MNVLIFLQFESKTVEDRLYETTKQLEDLKNTLDLKNEEVIKLKKIVSKQNEQLANLTVRLIIDKNLFFVVNLFSLKQIFIFLFFHLG